MSNIVPETSELVQKSKNNLWGWIAFCATVLAGTALYYEMRNPNAPLDGLLGDRSHFTVFANSSHPQPLP